uniref:Reverse transcriptase/retrotransposon-derived protein RNase H-like domain-containing protein n=1 Tax=Nicotiana tabacum TaxID=4097 RepID=A0A1S4AEB3_TOBAC|nr:PREDICTED: uncharacterized protein LOC107796679 [Nicotiana tabacum]
MASYTWTRLSGFSTKVAPLTELLNKNKPWVWTEHCQKAFEGLKVAVIEEPVLALPDFAKTFEVHTDASYFSIEGVLMQDKHLIAFESRNEAELHGAREGNDYHYALPLYIATLCARVEVRGQDRQSDALSCKADLATITSSSWDIREAIKEGMHHDPAAKQLIELATRARRDVFG